MLDIPSISAIVAALGVIIGVVFTAIQLRDLVKTRQTDLVIRLYSTYGSAEFAEAVNKILTMELKDHIDLWKKGQWSGAFSEVGSFFEGIGVLLNRKLIDIGLVDDLFSTPIKISWERTKPITEAARKHYKRPQIWEWFEYLYNEMQKRERQLTQKTA